MQLQDLDTPALVVDLDIMDRNLRRVADYCAQHNLRLRPHTKTHKSTFLAREQLALGAVGLTVAKVGEAEVMLGAAPKDLLVAYPVIGEAKMHRLAEVARRVNVTVALDSLTAATHLSEAAKAASVEFGILIEMDAGLGRVGVPVSEVIALSQAVSRLPNLQVRGVTFYPGHIRDHEERKIADLVSTLEAVRRAFEDARLDIGIVSGGSTPLLFESHRIAGMNEIRPGTYVFNDMNTVQSGGCSLADCAASVLVTVISMRKGERIIIDGGSKTFSSDRDNSGDARFGHVTSAPDSVFHKMNEEHGFIDIHGVHQDFEIGQKLRIIPNHICTAVNLHECVYGIRGGVVEEVWRVEARGKLQ
jgi:D-serine deaminase-like pyridoxal phosphate-dependent protein